MKLFALYNYMFEKSSTLTTFLTTKNDCKK